MTTFIGSIEAFMPGENFSQYRRRMENFLDVNSVPDDKKARTMLLLIGPVCYSKITSLVSPDTPEKKTYKDLMDTLEAHFKPPCNVIAERCKFYSRNRREGKSIDDFVVELKALSADYNFGQFLQNSLRDRLVSGINDKEIQSKLLLEKDLTWDSAVKICKAEELTRKNVREMDNSSGNANAVSSFNRKRPVRQKNKSRTDNKSAESCQRCGLQHSKGQCRAANSDCRTCGRKGHWSAMCRSKPPQGGAQHYLQLHQTAPSSSFHFSNPMFFEIRVDNIYVNFEVDTGAVCTVMGYDYVKSHFPNKSLEDTSVKLYQVNGDPANVKGRFEVRVNTYILSIFVIQTKDSRFTPLLGRDWLDILFPGWRNRLVNPIENSAPVQKVTRPESDTGILGEIKENFPNIVNTDDKNPIREFEAHIHMKEGVTPIFFKSRNIPLSSKPKVVRALDRLCEDDVMESVRHSDWASPIVPVPKGEDEVRICADFKVTINKHIEKEHYPLPQIDELLAKVGSGKKFCIVDCMGAFQQILVNEASRKYLTVNTIKGLFRFKRLCFGVSVAPSIFQNIMDQILAGIEGVVCYLDDLLIYGDNDEHVKKILWEVLGRMNHYNVKINVAKCKFFVDTLKFLGHIISAEGIKPNPEKLTALMDAPQPKNLKQLQAFLGLVNYYGKFIRDLASGLRPLYDLLKQENQDEVGQLLWREEHTRCFDRCKKLLSSEDILCHFDPNWEIVVAADASPDGLGAVMSHICPDGVERPVFFASRTFD
ncbi:hypothetical protein DMENIID0001_027950 [Sergentomyia squamirostris]